MIELTNVTYSYPRQQRPALNHLSLSIKEGESVCIMGANGCGKSTLALMLAGLFQPQGGCLEINDPSQAVLPVGLLFQNPDNQMVAVTVEKEVAFALENLGTPPDEMDRRIAETLERFRITHLRRRLTSELSGGEKQRVALASVMVLRPPILVLDEPDSFLDQFGKTFLAEELSRLKKDMPTLTEIRITQYPQMAKQYERLIVMQDGSVVADGNSSEILADDELCLRTSLRCSPPPDAAFLSVTPDLTPVDEALRHISAHRLRFGYPGEPPLIHDLNLTLKAGEILGLVGPSGSGKSSLAQLLCGLLKPTAGEIALTDADGVVLSGKQIQGGVTALFQQPERQFFLSTCAEEIAFGPANLGHDLTRAEIDAMFTLVGLDVEAFRGRDPITLSGGEKRRLAFAAVLSMRSRFVLFDEPTCGLDQEGVGRFLRLCRHLKKQDVGMLVVTHDGDIIYDLADRVLTLSDGGIARLRTRTQFFANPQLAEVVSPLSELSKNP